MMFRTCCCLRPKRKRSYLLIYITSDTS